MNLINLIFWGRLGILLRMGQVPRSPWVKFQIAVMIGFFAQSCGQVSTSSPSTVCTAGTAQIQIYDGFLRRACGCVEPSGQTYTSGLQCTVSAGTQMYFVFISISTTHQIAIPPLGTTQVRNANPNSSLQTDVIPLNQTGTFTFQDVYYPSLSGTIIVN